MPLASMRNMQLELVVGTRTVETKKKKRKRGVELAWRLIPCASNTAYQYGGCADSCFSTVMLVTCTRTGGKQIQLGKCFIELVLFLHKVAH